MTLADIWNEHVPTDGIVHFLKIDVEGFELAVLRGWDHEFHRPWVLVVEATEPGTQHEVHEAWEPLVLGARYHLVYADGINRFYVADERAELDAAFRYPPNVFDGYRVAATMAAEERASQFEVAAKEAEHRTENVVHDLEVALERIGWLSATLDESTARTAQVHRELVEVDAYSKGLLASIDVLATQLATVTSERDSAAARFAEAQQHHAAVIDEASRAHERAAQLDAHIRTMYASTSWKAARPVRLARRVLQRIARLRQRPASSRPVDPSEDPVPGVIEAQALEARPLERESTAESADTIHVLRMLSNATRSSGRGN